MAPKPVEQTAAVAEPHRVWGKWIGLAGIAIAAVTLWRTGAFHTLADREAFAAFIDSLGVWGPIAYLAIFTLTAGIGVPGVLYVVPAGLLWPPEIALSLVVAGSMGSSMVGFAFARWVARDWVQKRLPPWLLRYQDRLAERPFLTIVLLRVVLFLAPPVHWMLGISKVGVVPYTAATFIGLIPGMLLFTLAGKGFFQWLLDNPIALWLSGATAVGFWAWKKLKTNNSETKP